MKMIVLVGILTFVIGIVAGMGLQRFWYTDVCLDMGGGMNPGGYPICVIEK